MSHGVRTDERAGADGERNNCLPEAIIRAMMTLPNFAGTRLTMYEIARAAVTLRAGAAILARQQGSESTALRLGTPGEFLGKRETCVFAELLDMTITTFNTSTMQTWTAGPHGAGPPTPEIQIAFDAAQCHYSAWSCVRWSDFTGDTNQWLGGTMSYTKKWQRLQMRIQDHNATHRRQLNDTFTGFECELPPTSNTTQWVAGAFQGQYRLTTWPVSTPSPPTSPDVQPTQTASSSSNGPAYLNGDAEAGGDLHDNNPVAASGWGPMAPPRRRHNDAEPDILLYTDDQHPRHRNKPHYSTVNCLTEAILNTVRAKQEQRDRLAFVYQAAFLPRNPQDSSNGIIYAAVALRRGAGYEVMRADPLGTLNLHTRLLDSNSKLNRQDALSIAKFMRMAIRIFNTHTGEVWTTPVSCHWPCIDIQYDPARQHYDTWTTIGNYNTSNASFSANPWDGGGTHAPTATQAHADDRHLP
jgi:hypothetical protein